MSIQRTHIRTESGRTIGYLVNGRIIAVAEQYKNALRRFKDVSESNQLTLGIFVETEVQNYGHSTHAEDKTQVDRTQGRRS